MNAEQKAKVEALQKEHGRTAATVMEDGTLLVFRAPDLDEWEEFQESLKTKRRGAAYRELAQLTCVHPELEALQKVFKKYPAASIPIANVLSEMAGGEIELTVKKD